MSNKTASTTTPASRYELISEGKASGATYTPRELADFVAGEMLREWTAPPQGPLRLLDPAVGEGELLASLLRQVPSERTVEVYGLDNDRRALTAAAARLHSLHPKGELHLECANFLELVSSEDCVIESLFETAPRRTYDLIIANPPYVRTQIMGAKAARALARQFGLTGRVDLYHAFVLAISRVLRPRGMAGIIVSNRFMTTKAGASVRRAVHERLRLRHVWDLGDTKFFDAAVLPAVLIAEGVEGNPPGAARFSTIYETKAADAQQAPSITEALKKTGVVAIPDGRRFRIQHGTLDISSRLDGVWRVSTEESRAWLQTVASHTWATFGDLGKIRVGVKTCADRVFIRGDWDALPENERPELLRPLTTHHVARRFRAESTKRWIVYPHQSVGGKRRAVDLAGYPKTRRYLEQHQERLKGRKYVLDAGRNWYEIWVPQDPAAWSHPKMVFRDISEEPCFWIDQDETIVNGDCYWLVCNKPRNNELLWLAVSVANSSFIEAFYDRRFNNKLYSGRRRFITQYVEKFPLPDPGTPLAKTIVEKARAIYDVAGTESAQRLEGELGPLVWEAFGLPAEEISR